MTYKKLLMRHWMMYLVAAMMSSGSLVTADEKSIIRVVTVPEARLGNTHYVGNRAPLTESPLTKLPIGSIKPAGWLRRQLELEAAGFTGHLDQLSSFLEKEDNAWLNKDGAGKNPWEEVPYWLKGFGDLGYVLGDERIITEAKVWIEGVLASQHEDGYFGPRDNLTRLNGKADLWSNMVMLNAVQSYYEFSGDKRVLELMTGYFRWEMGRPDEDFLIPYWQQQRAGDNLASVYWLYNRTGEEWLLELADRIHKKTADWTAGVADWHNVNIAQCFREPAIYYQQAKDAYFLQATDRNYAMVWGLYGQVPGGLFGGDEMCRRSYYGPRQAVETCAIVEFMLSCEMLARISGEAQWLDRCEDAAFNTLTASMTTDLKALHYLTAPNLIQCDQGNKFPGINNGGDMFSFNPRKYRCCQHNVSHGWPYFAEHLWMAAPGNGLAATLYAACEVQATVGDGKKVNILEKTRYPFEETIEFEITSPDTVYFPLYLRVPGWCEQPEVSVNGGKIAVVARPQSYIVLERQWWTGDRIELHLPMKVTLRYWARNHDCISVDRGPLTYSLKIGERYERYKGTDEWPAYEIFPKTAWNYGLVIDLSRPVELQFDLAKADWPGDNQPFAVEAAPLRLTTTGRKIPNWQADHLGLIGEIQPNPAKSDEPNEKITLIPMGCARLRISAFPWVSDGAAAYEWSKQATPKAQYPAEASVVSKNDPVWSLVSLSDGITGKRSDDNNVGRFSWYPTRKSPQWVQYNFPQTKKIRRSAVYWYDNKDQVSIPSSWRLQYNNGAEWLDVPNPSEYGTVPDVFNEVTFDEVTAASLRLIAEFRPKCTAAILEWKVE